MGQRFGKGLRGYGGNGTPTSSKSHDDTHSLDGSSVANSADSDAKHESSSAVLHSSSSQTNQRTPSPGPGPASVGGSGSHTNYRVFDLVSSWLRSPTEHTEYQEFDVDSLLPRSPTEHTTYREFDVDSLWQRPSTVNNVVHGEAHQGDIQHICKTPTHTPLPTTLNDGDNLGNSLILDTTTFMSTNNNTVNFATPSDDSDDATARELDVDSLCTASSTTIDDDTLTNNVQELDVDNLSTASSTDVDDDTLNDNVQELDVDNFCTVSSTNLDDDALTNNVQELDVDSLSTASSTDVDDDTLNDNVQELDVDSLCTASSTSLDDDAFTNNVHELDVDSLCTASSTNIDDDTLTNNVQELDVDSLSTVSSADIDDTLNDNVQELDVDNFCTASSTDVDDTLHDNVQELDVDNLCTASSTNLDDDALTNNVQELDVDSLCTASSTDIDDTLTNNVQELDVDSLCTASSTNLEDMINTNVREFDVDSVQLPNADVGDHVSNDLDTTPTENTHEPLINEINVQTNTVRSSDNGVISESNDSHPERLSAVFVSPIFKKMRPKLGVASAEDTGSSNKGRGLHSVVGSSRSRSATSNRLVRGKLIPIPEQIERTRKYFKRLCDHQDNTSIPEESRKQPALDVAMNKAQRLRAKSVDLKIKKTNRPKTDEAEAEVSELDVKLRSADFVRIETVRRNAEAIAERVRQLNSAHTSKTPLRQQKSSDVSITNRMSLPAKNDANAPGTSRTVRTPPCIKIKDADTSVQKNALKTPRHVRFQDDNPEGSASVIGESSKGLISTQISTACSLQEKEATKRKPSTLRAKSIQLSAQEQAHFRDRASKSTSPRGHKKTKTKIGKPWKKSPTSVQVSPQNKQNHPLADFTTVKPKTKAAKRRCKQPAPKSEENEHRSAKDAFVYQWKSAHRIVKLAEKQLNVSPPKATRPHVLLEHY